jgi:hypothetical protein
LQNKNEEKVFPLYSFCYQTMPVAYWAGWGWGGEEEAFQNDSETSNLLVKLFYKQLWTSTLFAHLTKLVPNSLV